MGTQRRCCSQRPVPAGGIVQAFAFSDPFDGMDKEDVCSMASDGAIRTAQEARQRAPAYLRLAVSSLRAQREKVSQPSRHKGEFERAEPASKGDTKNQNVKGQVGRFHAKRDTPEGKDQWVRVRSRDELIEKEVGDVFGAQNLMSPWGTWLGWRYVRAKNIAP